MATLRNLGLVLLLVAGFGLAKEVAPEQNKGAVAESPGGGFLGAVQTMASIPRAAWETVVRTLTGNPDYKFGDFSKKVLKTLHHTTRDIIRDITNNPDYEIGDLSKKAAKNIADSVNSATQKAIAQGATMAEASNAAAQAFKDAAHEQLLAYTGKSSYQFGDWSKATAEKLVKGAEAYTQGVASGAQGLKDEAYRQAELLAAEQRKVAARNTLQEAVGSRVVRDLQAAILEGQEAGLENTELDSAVRVLNEEKRKESAEKRKVSARLGLQEAVVSRRLFQLQAAIREGQQAGLEKTELESAVFVLNEETRKEVARQKLKEATSSRSIESLEAAIKEGQEARLEEADLHEARAMLAAKRALLGAVEKRDIATLLAAIKQSEEAGLTEDDMKAAKIAVEEELQKAAAMASVNEAMTSKDVALLSSAIGAAEQVGVEAAKLKDARTMLAAEQRKLVALQKIEEALADKTISALHAAIKEGEGAGVDEAKLEFARATLAHEERMALFSFIVFLVVVGLALFALLTLMGKKGPKEKTP